MFEKLLMLLENAAARWVEEREARRNCVGCMPLQDYTGRRFRLSIGYLCYLPVWGGHGPFGD